MEYALYQAVQSYIPPLHDKNSLEIQKDDVLLISVQSSFSETASYRKGWLLAYNQFSGKKGYVPVEAVKLLGSQKNNTIHHPSAVGVDGVNVMLVSEKIRTSHQLTECYILNPILCIHCVDYIWGAGKVVLKCKGNFFKLFKGSLTGDSSFALGKTEILRKSVIFV